MQTSEVQTHAGLDTSLEQWCSAVWRELRKPLTTLLSPLDELARDPACAEIRPRLIAIQRNARLLLHLVDSLLLLTKLQEGRSLCEPPDHTTLLIEFSEFTHSELWKRVQQEWLATSGEQTPLSSPGSSTEGDSAFLTKLEALICSELDNPALDIRMICARLHFSPKQLQRKVRALTGLTPTEYLRQKRLRRAEEILLQGKSVSRTAYAAGFSSQSYFTTCFKKWAGETPRAWQKRMLRQS